MYFIVSFISEKKISSYGVNMITEEEARKIAIEDIMKNNRNVKEADIKIYVIEKEDRPAGDWIVNGAIPNQEFTMRISNKREVIRQFTPMTGIPKRK